MDITEIFAQLPPAISKDLQLQLEEHAVSTHLTADEAREIVDGVVHLVRINANLGTDGVDRQIDKLLSMVTNAIIGKIFA